MIYILAGNRKQAEIFAKRQRIDKRDFTYIHSGEELLGISPVDGDMMVSVGSFYERPDWRKIINIVVSRGFIINYDE